MPVGSTPTIGGVELVALLGIEAPAVLSFCDCVSAQPAPTSMTAKTGMSQVVRILKGDEAERDSPARVGDIGHTLARGQAQTAV